MVSARRSMSQYPLARGFYYGVNYAERGQQGVPESEVPGQFVPPHCQANSRTRNATSGTPSYAPNDLSFYANIPVPTSYMCMGSQENFLAVMITKPRLAWCIMPTITSRPARSSGHGATTNSATRGIAT